MKLAIIVPDGMADRPEDFPGQGTPLERAATPEMDAVAREGMLGRVVTVPESVAPGSDVAIMSILGADPAGTRVGRAALEAAGQGVELGDREVAFRANLVTLRGGAMEDYSAGAITTEEAKPLVEALAGALAEALAPEGARLHLGVSYRHLLVLEDTSGELEGLECTPPHDITGRQVSEHLPRGAGAERALAIMEKARAVLASHPANAEREGAGKRPANAIWLWGQGRRATLPGLRERFGLSGCVISAVDLVRGLGRSMGMDVIEVEGATGDLDTNYAGKGEAAAEALGHYDVVFCHIEAPDEASHRGDEEAKMEAIEAVDREVISRVGRRAEELAKDATDARVLVLPDHLTPLSIKTHAHGAVPFALSGTGVASSGAAGMTERAAGESETLIERGCELLAFALGMGRTG
ncbi:MAG: cofactor-independent phosphoglycerate mutase [Planctomycetota bacterium]|jgi:2,3-bisphosphoglycerate-independent phosphoglycerate mutase